MKDSRISPVAAEQLGPNGAGYFVWPDLLDTSLQQQLRHDLAHVSISWLVEKGTLVERPNKPPVAQTFDYFAHKLSRGNQETLKILPSYRRLIKAVMTKVVEPLSLVYPSLNTWKADEIAAQRYPANGYIGEHSDRARFFGLIVVTNPIGSARLSVVNDKTLENEEFTLTEGDALIMRATNLFPAAACPEHEVLDTSPGRVSVTLRANSLPDEEIAGYIFHNWPGSANA